MSEINAIVSIQQWRVFFDDLNVKHRTIVTELGNCLELQLSRLDRVPTYWYGHVDMTEEVIQKMQAFSNQTDRYIVISTGEPNPPKIKLRCWKENGKRVATWKITGVSLLLLFPPSASMNPIAVTRTSSRFQDRRWRALHEDAFGDLSIWPISTATLPLKKEEYTKPITCIDSVMGLVDSIYIGCGRSPTTDRLLKAYKQMSAVNS